ncbi:DUF6932 family protein [Prosthecochloris sp. CIB 2401]|uniref:DUF6932 family protein n=1 Tax=Prosthecochloris sp. CIB 2401 TaxID=1868325 RepID=UPI00083A34AC|nr:hypothetical protein [Prosthecochloris sp. CIB 2401]
MSGNLPHWNGAGVLPPVRPEAPGSSPERSPYRVPLTAFVDRFATSPERMAILDSFLRFREKLNELGIISGFQWLDGSFLEQIERLENRQPRDMDVVTFFTMPTGETQHSLLAKSAQLFDQKYLKENFAVDGYFSVLGQPVDARQVQSISYWYSMWSHRRDGLWKGFVQIDLDPSQNAEARAVLNISGGAQHE